VSPTKLSSSDDSYKIHKFIIKESIVFCLVRTLILERKAIIYDKVLPIYIQGHVR